MLLIYTEKLSPRINYVFRQVCGNILGFEVGFTSKIEEFIAHEGMKLSYGKQKMGNELFVQQADLLTEQGFSDIEIKISKWGDIPCFFRVSEQSDIPFDIFAASFYLLSRYEEYLPFVKDSLGRFPAEESLAFKHGFLRKPIVDIWAFEFEKILLERFPNEKIPRKKPSVKTIIAVAEAYRYRKRGMVRTIGGAMRDLAALKPRLLLERFKVLTFNVKDPYDVFDVLVGFLKKKKLGFQFMFQLSDYSRINKNLSFHKKKYQSLIKSMGDYAKTGLLLGDDATTDFKTLRAEKRRYQNIMNTPLEFVLNDRFNLNLPEAYNNFDKLEIKRDFSMGYVNSVGFRAGTSHPFLFYDIALERISPLVVEPYAFNSKMFKRAHLSSVRDELLEVAKETQKISGNLNLIFENSDFSTPNNQAKLLDLIERLDDVVME
jgi:hypothetical protein